MDPRARPPPDEGPPLTPEGAASALRAALCDAPSSYAVAWADGARGGVAERQVVSAADLTAELRARIGVAHPKGEGPVLVPAALDPARSRVTRDAVESVTLAVADHDAETCTLGAALAAVERVGLAAWGYPTPSAPLGPAAGATRWRLLVPLAEGTDPAAYALAGAVLRRALEAVLGAALDGSTWRPEALCYVSPRPSVGGRGADAVLTANGGAVDLAGLADAAAAAGWWGPREARAAGDARRAGVRDGAALVAVLELAGLVLGPPDRRGWAPLRCPRAHWHGSRAPTRRDTSAVVHTATGACVCAHDHSAAPAEHRGPANTARVLAWLRADRPEFAPALALARDAGSLGVVREALAHPPSGEAPRRVVDRAAVAEDVADALAAATRRECLVLHTPTVGAGKSRAIGAAIVRALREGGLHPAPATQRPLASCGVAVRDRAAIADVAGAILRASAAAGMDVAVAVRVYTPAHEIPTPGGGALECVHHVEAERLYRLGASARASLCTAVPTPVGPQPCPRRHECRARDPWVLWVLDPEGAPVPTTAVQVPPGAAWVAVAPHASAHALAAALREGAPLVVDEADDALRPVVAQLDPGALDAACAWADALAPVRTEGRRPGDCHAPREVSRVLAAAARAAGVEALAAVPPEARAAWCVAALTPALAHPKVAAWCRQWVDAPDTLDGAALAAAMVERWPTANVMAVRAARGRIAPAGVAALRALQRWAAGGHARRVTDDDGESLSLAWATDAAALCKRVLDRAGGVLALDATGSPDVARAAVTDAARERLVLHDPVRVEGGAEVRRVLVHSSRAGRRALTPRGGVQWDAATDVLRAALGALRAGQREGCGMGPGVIFAARPLAMVCEALAAVGPEGSEAAVREALAAHRAWRSLTERARERLAAAARAAPPAARRALAELTELGGDVRWTWFGSTEARGSNEHRARAWSVTAGDARPSLEGARSALWSVTGADPSDTELRAACDAAAAKAHTQAHGRTRAVQRPGEVLLAVHIGQVPPEDWRALPEAPTVVSVAGAIAWGAAPAPRSTAAAVADVVADVVADAAAPVADTADPDVRAAAAAGWTLAELQRATGRDRATVRAWWRGERGPRRVDDRAAVRALARGETTPTLRAILCRLANGRGWARVWAGVGGVSGLARRLEVAGATASSAAVHRWAEVPTAPLPLEVVGAIARAMPELVRVFPPVGDLPSVARPLVEAPREPRPEPARPLPRPVFGPVRAQPQPPRPEPRPARVQFTEARRVAGMDAPRSSVVGVGRPPGEPRPPPRGP